MYLARLSSISLAFAFLQFICFFSGAHTYADAFLFDEEEETESNNNKEILVPIVVVRVEHTSPTIRNQLIQWLVSYSITPTTNFHILHVDGTTMNIKWMFCDTNAHTQSAFGFHPNPHNRHSAQWWNSVTRFCRRNIEMWEWPIGLLLYSYMRTDAMRIQTQLSCVGLVNIQIQIQNQTRQQQQQRSNSSYTTNEQIKRLEERRW